MRPTVGAVTSVLRLALVCAAAACGYRMLPTHADFGPHGVAWNLWSHAAATYGLTLLSFAAFARTRRGDIVKVMLVVFGLIEALRHVAGCDVGAFDFVADAAGAVTVLAPSHLERFRSAARRASREPFTLTYSGERRARRLASSPAAATPARANVYARDRA